MFTLACYGVCCCPGWLQAITEHGLYQRTADSIPEDAWGQGMVTLVGDAAHTAYVDGTGLALSLGEAGCCVLMLCASACGCWRVGVWHCVAAVPCVLVVSTLGVCVQLLHVVPTARGGTCCRRH